MIMLKFLTVLLESVMIKVVVLKENIRGFSGCLIDLSLLLYPVRPVVNRVDIGTVALLCLYLFIYLTPTNQ